jgi:prepilin-type N-terminal cleavage/methylation domain-containing protein
MEKQTMKTLHGFSLVEMAIVILILALLMGSLLTPISTQLDQQRIKATEKTLEDIKKALLGFAVIKQRLPCPDTDEPPDGIENTDSTVCYSNSASYLPWANYYNSEGYLPWVTLGVGKQDAWGRPFRYRVAEKLNKLSGIDLQQCMSSGLRIKNRQGNYYFTVKEDDSRVAAIIFSYGKNGKPDEGNGAGSSLKSDNLCGSEKVTNVTYLYDAYVEGDFDDILVWLSKNTLVHRLGLAGKLPDP